MATINGTPVNFAFGSDVGLTSSVYHGNLQTVDQSKASDLEVVRGGDGEERVHSFYNIHDEATLEYVIIGANLAGAITNTTLGSLLPGTLISITACANRPDLVATTWEIQSGVKISGSNTTAARISLPLKKFANITAVAS